MMSASERMGSSLCQGLNEVTIASHRPTTQLFRLVCSVHSIQGDLDTADLAAGSEAMTSAEASLLPNASQPCIVFS